MSQELLPACCDRTGRGGLCRDRCPPTKPLIASVSMNRDGQQTEEGKCVSREVSGRSVMLMPSEDIHEEDLECKRPGL